MSSGFGALLASCDRFRLTSYGADDVSVSMPVIWDATLRRVRDLVAAGKVRVVGEGVWGRGGVLPLRAPFTL